jgi:hypothetical protein
MALVMSIGAAVYAAGSYMSYQGQKKAAEMEAKGLQAQNEANKYGNSIKRRAMIQQTRQTIGTVATSYASSGAGSSRTSSQQATISSQRTGLARSIRDSGILQNYGDQIVNYSIEAQRGNTFAALGGVVSSVGSAIMSFGMASAPVTTPTTVNSVSTTFGARGSGAISQGIDIYSIPTSNFNAAPSNVMLG